MKRDLDLVREILLYYEVKDNDAMDDCPEIEGYESLQVNYHLLLMDEAGLLRCEREVSKSTPSRVIKVHPFSLTWAGHEFLSAARNDSLWVKAKNIAATKGGALSFAVVKSLLLRLALEGAGLHK